MSVIIRLQNLPWSANALDIRQFFKGLSIPEGGVHIVGGEMGDAFIAFSTDEDARQAMMKDRGKLNEVQVRLLLSSRAEMQKVIETARQQSLLALQKSGAIPAATTVAPIKTTTSLSTPQPPVITTNSLQNILGTQLGAAPSFQTYQQQAGITLIPTPSVKTESSSEAKISSRRESNESSTRDRRRSTSRDRRRSRSRDRSDRSSGRRRRERSRSRDRDRDRKSGRSQRSSRRSRSREHSRDRARNGNRSNRNSRDCDTNSNSRSNRDNPQRSSVKNTDTKDSASSAVKASTISSWNMPPTNAYETGTAQNTSSLYNTQAQRSMPLNNFATATESGMRPNISNAYTTSPSINEISSQTPSSNLGSKIAAALPNFQNFSTTTSTTNNYSINFLSNPGVSSNTDAIKPAFALQNPYTAALRAASSNSNSQDSNSSSVFSPNLQQSSPVYPGVLLDKKPIAAQQTVPPVLAGASPLNTFAQQSPQQQQQTLVPQQQPVMQQPIAFANTNPYAQMYPNLFAQAAAAGTGIANTVRSNIQNQNSKPQDQKFSQRSGGSNEYKGSQRNNNDEDNDNNRSCSLKISNMCSSTTYSDLRKFFSGLFIPHNGIKMINDRDGLRTGVAYIQFSRSSCVGKAMIRNNTFLKMKRVLLEPVTDEEFLESEDSYKPHRDRDNYSRFNRNDAYDGGNRGGYENRYDNRNSPSQGRDDGNSVEGNARKQQFPGDAGQEPLTVLHIEEIPAMATELDIMKMFSVFTIFDILLTVSPGNRREFTAYVKFSREEEAKAALMEQSRHVIGHRKVRVRPARAEEMERAKEKLRLANEQLQKEEAAMSAAAEKDDECDNDANEDFNNIDDDNENEGDDDDLTIVCNDGDLNEANEREDSNQHDGCSDVSNNLNAPASEEYKPFKDGPSDPRLRRQRPSRFAENTNNDSTSLDGGDNNDKTSGFQNMPPQPFNGPNFNPSFNAPPFAPMNNMENNFIILKNCDYSTRINNVAQLMMSENLVLRHVELLRNERQMPTGEFIVEFANPKDAVIALNRFNNTTFRNRNLRVRDITPQEIADRIGKPFMNYFPGGGRGGPMPMRGNFDLSGRGPPPNFRSNDGYMDGNDRPRFDNMSNNMNNRNRGGGFGSGADDRVNQNMSPMMRGGVGGGGGRGGERSDFNNQDMYMDDDDDDNRDDIVDCDNDNIDKSENEDEIVSVSSNGPATGDDSSSIPEKFSRPGCVLAMENVPFKADLKDIIEFFGEFDVMADDIIRRFNDDGSPTGDARVAFPTPAKARAAFEAKRQHTIFNRTIYINTL